MSYAIVGTAGHIDHGKTALVKALTGIDADRLKEEKERGITIDIGFAHMSLGAGGTLGFIDVPGHERFIKNMLAGVGGIDLVMLVIAADESVMPQTREHLDICSLLRIKQGFTVLTKIDKVDSDMADLVEVEVRDFLKGSFLEDAPILRVSAQTGRGIAELTGTLQDFVSRTKPKDTEQIFRLPIDRCFTMKGFGTVVTGTLIAGLVRKEQDVEILPIQRATRVRGIQVYGRPASEARAGQRAALNLQNIEVADIQRGMVVADAGLFTPTSMFDCELELLGSARSAIQSRKRIRFHIGAAEVMGYAVLLGQDRLEPGNSAFAQIRLEEPAFALPGDRFIIRQYSPMITIGGGEILDGKPEKHRRSDSRVLDSLNVFKRGHPESSLMVIIEEAGLHGIDLPALVSRRGTGSAEVRKCLMRLAEQGRVRILSDNPMVVVSRGAFEAAANAGFAAVKKFHVINPLAQGMGREELKARLFKDASNLVFQAVLDNLTIDRKISMLHDLVQEFGRKPTLRSDEERMRALLLRRFEDLGLQASPPDQIIESLGLDRPAARKIVQFMLKENLLVKITDDIIIARGALDKLVAQLKSLRSSNPKLGVPEFKEMTGVSRKYAIPLLEYLDRQRVTRRLGDERIIL
jgi:selenocysteine-specific elongation factor